MTFVMALVATDAARSLVERHVDTFEKLTIFLALARIHNARWSLDALGHVLATHPTKLKPAVDQLCLSGLVSWVPGGTKLLALSPVTPELARAAQQLYSACLQDRGAVVDLVIDVAARRRGMK